MASNQSTAGKVTTCLGSFKSLCAALRDLGETGDDAAAVHLEGMPEAKIEDEQRRFKIWAGNIGAHKSGRSSLDYRLRDASHVLRQVNNLLTDLGESLSDATEIILGKRTPWDQELMDDDSDDSEDDSFFGDKANLDIPTAPIGTELSQILAGITEIVTCLFRLSVSIRNPAPHDRFKQSIKTDTSWFEPYDIEHVRTRFPSATDSLAHRLGQANSYRRQYFKYRQLHHQKLSQGLDVEPGEVLVEGEPAQSTVASSIPLHMKGSGAGGGGGGPREISVLDEDVRSESGVSMTSLATSVADSGRPKVPPLPKEAESGPFECPFCFMMISATTPVAWKKHVYGDLRPYVCLHDDCPMPFHDFHARHKWMQHVVNVHAVDCSEDVFAKCPLCGDALKSKQEYQRHVGRHQTELALFALPKIGGDDEAGQDTDVSDGGLSQDDGHEKNSEESQDEDPAVFNFSDVNSLNGQEASDVPNVEAHIDIDTESQADATPAVDPSLPGLTPAQRYAVLETDINSHVRPDHLMSYPDMLLSTAYTKDREAVRAIGMDAILARMTNPYYERCVCNFCERQRTSYKYRYAQWLAGTYFDGEGPAEVSWRGWRLAPYGGEGDPPVLFDHYANRLKGLELHPPGDAADLNEGPSAPGMLSDSLAQPTQEQADDQPFSLTAQQYNALNSPDFAQGAAGPTAGNINTGSHVRQDRFMSYEAMFEATVSDEEAKRIRTLGFGNIFSRAGNPYLETCHCEDCDAKREEYLSGYARWLWETHLAVEKPAVRGPNINEKLGEPEEDGAVEEPALEVGKTTGAAAEGAESSTLEFACPQPGCGDRFSTSIERTQHQIKQWHWGPGDDKNEERPDDAGPESKGHDPEAGRASERAGDTEQFRCDYAGCGASHKTLSELQNHKVLRGHWSDEDDVDTNEDPSHDAEVESQRRDLGGRGSEDGQAEPFRCIYGDCGFSYDTRDELNDHLNDHWVRSGHSAGEDDSNAAQYPGAGSDEVPQGGSGDTPVPDSRPARRWGELQPGEKVRCDHPGCKLSFNTLDETYEHQRQAGHLADEDGDLGEADEGSPGEQATGPDSDRVPNVHTCDYPDCTSSFWTGEGLLAHRRREGHFVETDGVTGGGEHVDDAASDVAEVSAEDSEEEIDLEATEFLPRNRWACLMDGCGKHFAHWSELTRHQRKRHLHGIDLPDDDYQSTDDAPREEAEHASDGPGGEGHPRDIVGLDEDDRSVAPDPIKGGDKPHGEKVSWMCPHPGCGSLFESREDLERHYAQEKHLAATPSSEIQQATPGPDVRAAPGKDAEQVSTQPTSEKPSHEAAGPEQDYHVFVGKRPTEARTESGEVLHFWHCLERSCRMVFRTRADLLSHCRLSHRDAAGRRESDEVSSDEAAWKRFNPADRKATYHCGYPGCKSTFGRPIALRTHQEETGHDEDRCVFPGCQSAFTTRRELRQHMQQNGHFVGGNDGGPGGRAGTAAVGGGKEKTPLARAAAEVYKTEAQQEREARAKRRHEASLAADDEDELQRKRLRERMMGAQGGNAPPRPTARGDYYYRGDIAQDQGDLSDSSLKDDSSHLPPPLPEYSSQPRSAATPMAQWEAARVTSAYEGSADESEDERQLERLRERMTPKRRPARPERRISIVVGDRGGAVEDPQEKRRAKDGDNSRNEPHKAVSGGPQPYSEGPGTEGVSPTDSSPRGSPNRDESEDERHRQRLREHMAGRIISAQPWRRKSPVVGDPYERRVSPGSQPHSEGPGTERLSPTDNRPRGSTNQIGEGRSPDSIATRKPIPSLDDPSQQANISEETRPKRYAGEHVPASASSGSKDEGPPKFGTRLSLDVVSPEALELGKETFEVRGDHVFVERALMKREVERYVAGTKILRGEPVLPIRTDILRQRGEVSEARGDGHDQLGEGRAEEEAGAAQAAEEAAPKEPAEDMDSWGWTPPSKKIKKKKKKKDEQATIQSFDDDPEEGNWDAEDAEAVAVQEPEEEAGEMHSWGPVPLSKKSKKKKKKDKEAMISGEPDRMDEAEYLAQDEQQESPQEVHHEDAPGRPVQRSEAQPQASERKGSPSDEDFSPFGYFERAVLERVEHSQKLNEKRAQMREALGQGAVKSPEEVEEETAIAKALEQLDEMRRSRGFSRRSAAEDEGATSPDTARSFPSRQVPRQGEGAGDEEAPGRSVRSSRAAPRRSETRGRAPDESLSRLAGLSKQVERNRELVQQLVQTERAKGPRGVKTPEDVARGKTIAEVRDRVQEVLQELGRFGAVGEEGAAKPGAAQRLPSRQAPQQGEDVTEAPPVGENVEAQPVHDGEQPETERQEPKGERGEGEDEQQRRKRETEEAVREYKKRKAERAERQESEREGDEGGEDARRQRQEEAEEAVARYKEKEAERIQAEDKQYRQRLEEHLTQSGLNAEQIATILRNEERDYGIGEGQGGEEDRGQEGSGSGDAPVQTTSTKT